MIEVPQSPEEREIQQLRHKLSLLEQSHKCLEGYVKFMHHDPEARRVLVRAELLKEGRA